MTRDALCLRLKNGSLLDQVRSLAVAHAECDDELDFYGTARRLGCSSEEAESIDRYLTERIMLARGAI